MFKKIFIILTLYFFGLLNQNVFSFASIPVENIFSDIGKNYKYIDELQVLYDKGMIKPDVNGKFSPLSLLNRDEFVGILMEITCKKCIQPNVDLELVEKYENKQLFFDINKENKYLYCIASANEEGFVQGYQIGSTCDDGTFSEGEKPFCASNTINLEEAIAIVLRASGIMTKEEAERIEQDIYNGIIIESLSDDVNPKNIDGSVYSFYPYLKKALEYEILDVDVNGNTEINTLIEVVNGKIRPKQYISKEDFLQIAYLALQANSCNEKTEKALALKINIYDEICQIGDTKCELSTLNDENDIYDFDSEVYSTCELGISETGGYIWRFYNINTGQEIKKYGKYIDNYKFLNDGKWQIFLRVIDKCGNTKEVYNYISVYNNDNLNSNLEKNLSVSIESSAISGETALLIKYKSIVSGGIGPYTYEWDFGNGNKGLGEKTENIYNKENVYEVVLFVTDRNGLTSSATISIQAIGKNECNIDTDGDSINDCYDICPLIKGDFKNKGCPILERQCSVDTDCGDGYTCSDLNICLPKLLKETCEYNGGDAIFGNMLCNSCPCNYFLDFTSELRTCDIIFPAITSKDSKIIFSKGENYQIK